MNDYYAMLDVPPTATSAEIRRAYHRLARKYHPDLNQQLPGSDQRIKRLNEAYAILSDPARRATYDADRAKRGQQSQPPQEPRMTWAEGVVGFVKELRKALREE